MKKQLLSITLLFITLFTFGQVPTSERDALIALYNSADGANWTNNTNWDTTEPVSTWFGITVENSSGQDHVTSIDFGYSSNNLNGSLPSELSDIFKLRTLIITFNPLLTGNIPVEIGNLYLLENLTLWSNGLTGNIPDEIGNCNHLSVLALHDNQLIGNVPNTFSALTSLESFYLNGNQLTGNIPNIFLNMIDLWLVYLHSNQLSGSLNLSNSPLLNHVHLNDNLFFEIDLRNGNNTNISNVDFNVINNPNLTCVFVDDANWSETNWTDIDATATFLETQAECDALSINDETFKQDIEIYPNPTSGILHIRNNENLSIKKIAILNTLGQKIINSQAISNIDISNLPNGIYYINIENIEGNKASYKIIKE